MPTSRTASQTSTHDETLAPIDQRTPLLYHTLSSRSQGSSYHRPSCQQAECEHGALSPHASRPNSSSSVLRTPLEDDQNAYTPTHLGPDYEPQPSDTHQNTADGFGGNYGEERDLTHGILGDAITDGVLGNGAGEVLRRHNAGTDGQTEDGTTSAKDRGRGPVAAMSTTQYLAKSHGVKGSRIMYVVICGRNPAR